MNFFIKTYGCQMNVYDSQIVTSLLIHKKHILVSNYQDADIVLINTCTIRDKAVQTVLNYVNDLKYYKKHKNHDLIIGILGCLAQHMSKHWFEILDVNFVIGPDEYRNISDIIDQIQNNRNEKICKAKLSTTETYNDILPYCNENIPHISAFLTIMRGCNNMCSYCVVPFTRGRERSKDHNSIIQEYKYFIYEGFKEIILLGQNVDSYRDNDVSFAVLLDKLASINDKIRIRFTTSHPKDLTTDVLKVMKNHDNICKHIHLPIQSGSNDILKMMNRKYSREEYLDKIYEIRDILGDTCGLTTDIMVGFCNETDKDFEDTIDIMNKIKYDSSYTFAYSQREGTQAQKSMIDNIPDNVKKQRLTEIINLQREHSQYRNDLDLNNTYKVLVEDVSKKSNNELQCRTDHNKIVIINKDNHNIGDFVKVKITESFSSCLKGITHE